MPKNEYKSGTDPSPSPSAIVASVCRPIWVDNFTVCWQLRWTQNVVCLLAQLLTPTLVAPSVWAIRVMLLRFVLPHSCSPIQKPLSWHLHALLAAIKHQERTMQSQHWYGSKWDRRRLQLLQEQLLRWTLLWFKHASGAPKWLPCQLVYGSLCRQMYLGIKWPSLNRLQVSRKESSTEKLAGSYLSYHPGGISWRYL